MSEGHKYFHEEVVQRESSICSYPFSCLLCNLELGPLVSMLIPMSHVEAQKYEPIPHCLKVREF